ncbi:MAG: Asp-tRNA(Asn)/Glu-tRNA(Gln) amidotransferase subunit GatB [Syntrophomonadaceae bacterium]|nr:Asp-tRNA(Asn)/Glu-tRNA(Gln) amidotransferase subunit GatB [Syntrophomonadaceae bacterium]
MTGNFEAVIGLEVHAELKTATKIFCSCSTAFGAEPNTQVCPVCSGFPGMLPVLNREVVNIAIKAGLAMNSDIPPVCKFDRKNYFYPDSPKAYQISQFDQPVCVGGYLDIELDGVTKRIGITRAHMEEDAGKLVHQGDISTTTFSLVDLNRCGVPLLEIVSEPDMRSAREARAYAEKLRSILLFAGVSDCRMQEGSLRFDANVSVRPRGQQEFGTRTETKNLNSFSALERAVEYEIRRQIEAIEDGERIIQETRTWDEEKGVTRAMRSKEEAHDYRYFPEPDLPPIHIDDAWRERIRAAMPELPDAARERLVRECGLPEYDAGVLTVTPDSLKFFDEARQLGGDPKALSNWMMGELNRLLNLNAMELEDCKITPVHLTDMLKMMESGQISGKMAKTVFEEMFATGHPPQQVVEEKGMAQISDADSLWPIIAEAVAANPKALEDYKNGKQKAFGSFVGQIMKATKGQANPAMVNELLKQYLDGGNV